MSSPENSETERKEASVMAENKEEPGPNDRPFTEGNGRNMEDKEEGKPAENLVEKSQDDPDSEYVEVTKKDIEDVKQEMAEKEGENITEDATNGAVSKSTDESQSSEESAPGTHTQEFTDHPVNCPVYKSSVIASMRVFYFDNLNYHVHIKPKNEANEVLSEENQNQDQPHKEESSAGNYWAILNGLWKSKLKICTLITGQTFGACEAIMEKVKNNRNPWFSSTFAEEVIAKDSDIIIVFCPITSRVGSDVESAMTDPQVSSSKNPVILVLMHHTRDVNYSTAGIKWSEVYKNVELEVHVLFHETIPGLLNCQQNYQAMDTIQQKLYSYWK